jgi:hypothetical protein
MPRASDPWSRRAYWIVPLIAAVVCGCTPELTLAPVEGVVKKAGKPAAKVEVIFMADGDTRGPRASAWTDAEGRYRLRTATGLEGAPVGTHRVCLIDQSSLTAQAAAATLKGVPDETLKDIQGEKAGKIPPGVLKAVVQLQLRIPEQYSRPDETPLRAEVLPGPQTINFDIP